MKKIFKSPFFWAFIIGILSLHIIKECALRNRAAPDPMVIVPDWSLIDQDSKNFGKADLLGKVYVAQYFFTSCPSICPKITESMKEIYQRFDNKSDKIEFISISVDPETDRPEVLKAFMEKNNINHKNWHALTGSKKEVYSVVVEKMRVHMGEKEIINDGVYDIPHLAELALFDQNGDLRGLFKTDSIEMSALVRAIKFLVEKS